MNKFFVICTVNNVDYLTDVLAESALCAENKILGLSICGRHEYAVTNAQAFTLEEIKYEYFSDCIQNCECISFDTLSQIIESVNASIREKDSIELDIELKIKQIKELEGDLEILKSKATALGLDY